MFVGGVGYGEAFASSSCMAGIECSDKAMGLDNRRDHGQFYTNKPY